MSRRGHRTMIRKPAASFRRPAGPAPFLVCRVTSRPRYESRTIALLALAEVPPEQPRMVEYLCGSCRQWHLRVLG